MKAVTKTADIEYRHGAFLGGVLPDPDLMSR